MVKSAERVAVLLQILAQNPSGLLFSNIEHDLSLPKSSLHALLATMMTTNMVRYDEDTNRYSLGPLVWELAAAFSQKLQLVPTAVPHLERLSANLKETVQMAILDGSDIVYVAKSDSPRPVQLVSTVGSRLPAHATGLGKALLATLPPHRLERLYATDSLPTFTATTIQSVTSLKCELEATRYRGYALDAEEYTLGLYCMAMPIISADHKAVAALSVSLPQDRYLPDHVEEIIRQMTEETHRLSYSLGSLNPEYWRTVSPQHNGSPFKGQTT